MREIKTKPEGGSPKLLKRAAKMPKAAMKDIWLKATEKTVSEVKETPFDSLRDESTNAPANNGGEQMVSGIETAVKKGTDMAGRVGETVASTAARKVKKARETALAFQKQFQARCGSCLCRELLGYDLSDPAQEQAARDSGKLIDYCPTPVLAAIEILDTLLDAEG